MRLSAEIDEKQKLIEYFERRFQYMESLIHQNASVNEQHQISTDVSVMDHQTRQEPIRKLS